MQALETVQDFSEIFHEITNTSREIKHFVTIPGHRQTYHNYEQAWQRY